MGSGENEDSSGENSVEFAEHEGEDIIVSPNSRKSVHLEALKLPPLLSLSVPLRGKSEKSHGTPRRSRRVSIKPRGLDSIMEEERNELGPIVTSFGDYQIGEFLGKGSFGKVFKGLNTKTGQFVAIKEFALIDQHVVAEHLPLLLKEIQLLEQLHHPNIVRYIDCHLINNLCMHIVMEFMENGSLKNILDRFGIFSESLAARYASQFMLGLEYLHQRDILHRDIKGANILITKEGICKLADFGVAIKFQPGDDSGAAGTTYWMAPELFEMENASPASDVWSVGCTVLELLTGSPPYHDMPKTQAMYHIIENSQPPLPDCLSVIAKDFLNCCFQRDPNNRSTISELLQHPWITNELQREPELTNSTNNLKKVISSVEVDLVKQQFEYHATDMVAENAQEYLQKLSMKNKSDLEPDPADMDIETLRHHVLELRKEKELLIRVAENIQSHLSSQVLSISTELKEANEQLEKSHVFRDRMAEKISVLADAFSLNHSDMKFAKLIYGRSLPITHFKNGIRGVLLLKRAVNTGANEGVPVTLEQHKAINKHQWKKRWILLQDNFLFCYKADQTSDPVLVFRLGTHKITPVSEREVGKKYCFLLTCGKKSYYLAAANPQVLLKWLNVLSHDELVYWFVSEDSMACESDEETPGSSTTISKSDSTLSLTESDSHGSSDVAPAGKQNSLKRAISRMRSIDHQTPDPFPGIRLHTEESPEPSQPNSPLKRGGVERRKSFLNFSVPKSRNSCPNTSAVQHPANVH